MLRKMLRGGFIGGGVWVVGWLMAAAPAEDTADRARRQFLFKFAGAVLGLTVGSLMISSVARW